MRKFCARVITRTDLGKDLFHITLNVFHSQAAAAAPGQFIQVYCRENEFGPLLPRPFSLFRINSNHGESINSWEILFRKVGRGTSWLSRRQPGDELEILGPLGRGFSLFAEQNGGLLNPSASASSNTNTSTRARRSLLIAGGIGMPPLFALAERLYDLKTQIILVYAGKTREDLIFLEEWRRLAHHVCLVTEDGSAGFKGLATEAVKTEIYSKGVDFYYSCGPRPMLKAVQTLLATLEIPGEISMEERMACGVGACLGCAIKTSGGYKRVCREGPVFRGDEVIFDA